MSTLHHLAQVARDVDAIVVFVILGVVVTLVLLGAILSNRP